MNARSQPCRSSLAPIAALLTAALMLTACASTPVPTESLQDARHAIATAEQGDAGRYASGELSSARLNLEAANKAVSGKMMISAQRFAEESRADAELASAKTADVKANAVNDEIKQSTATLVEEMRRNSGDSQ